MATIRLKSFDIEGVNTALSQLQTNIKGVISGSGSITVDQLNDIYNEVRNIIESYSDRYVPITRTINDIALQEDIDLTSHEIPFEEVGGISTHDQIRLLATPISIDGFADTYYDLLLKYPIGFPGQGVIVLSDETHNQEQWLYTWNDDGSGIYRWNATAPFGINISRYYTKDQTYSKEEVDISQSNQSRDLTDLINTGDTSTFNNASLHADTAIAASESRTNTNITTAINNQKVYYDNLIESEVEKLVPKTLKINNYVLDRDIIIKALDIPTSDNRTVQAALDAFTSIINIQGAVDNESDLPSGRFNGTGFVVRNGTHYPAGPDGPYPELFVVVEGSWMYICRLLINLDLFYTKEQVDNKILQETSRAVLSETQLQSDIDRIESDYQDADQSLRTGLNAETTRATTAENNLSANIASSFTSAVNESNEYTDLQVNQFYGTLSSKVSTTYPHYFIELLSTIYNPTTIQLKVDTRDLNENTITTYLSLNPVTTSTAGLFTSTMLQQFQQALTDIANLHNQGVYIGISFPTRAALNAYVTPSWVTVNNFTYVINDETQIQHDGSQPTTQYFYTNVNGVLQWTYGFIVNHDIPLNFTNTYKGIIQGIQSDGYLESLNGWGHIYGWEALKDRVSATEAVNTQQNTAITNLQNVKADKNNISEGGNPYINYNAQGLITSSRVLIESDIPQLTISKITNLDAYITAEINKIRLTLA